MAQVRLIWRWCARGSWWLSAVARDLLSSGARGALADPTLAWHAARELGAGGLQPSVPAPVSWPSVVGRYGDLCRAAGLPPIYILAHVKQWLRLASPVGNQSRFEALKGCQDLGELLSCLRGAS